VVRRNETELQHDIITVALEQLGQQAIYHQDFVPEGCWRTLEQSPACMEVGLGQDGMYDCSGLVISALSYVIGRKPSEWPPDLRHTRDLWSYASGGTVDLGTPFELSSGDLLVMRRRWTIEGKDYWIPAHMGIITGMHDQGLPVLLEAQAKVGKVIERPVETIENILGVIKISELIEFAR